jgi:hypothetical protein
MYRESAEESTEYPQGCPLLDVGQLDLQNQQFVDACGA